MVNLDWVHPEFTPGRDYALKLTGRLIPAFAILFVIACGGGSHSALLANPPASAPEVQTETVPALTDQAPTPAPAPAVVAQPLPLPWAPAPAVKDRAAPAPPVSALAAVVVDEASNTVLFDKDAHLALAPASVTKIATLILALEHGDLDQWVVTDVDSASMRGSTVMGLEPGDGFPLRDLLYGLMLPSGNDAALAIARAVAGSDAAFVAQMNGLLARFGLTDSHFSNPHGLGGNDHNASAYDLAELARYGMSLPGFREISTAPFWTARGTRNIPLANINTFLYGYRGADGVKTGYTRRAGPTMVASATRDGHRLYAVILNSPDRNGDASKLLTWAFTNFNWAP